MYRSLAVICIWICALSRPAVAAAQDPPDYAAGRKAAMTELIKRLENLAEWCNSEELFEERDRVWRSILTLDTNDVAARKGLRYARNPDGSWKEPAPREAKNMNRKALEEQLPAKRTAAIEPYRTALMTLLAKEPESSKLRQDAYAEILGLDPDDVVVRGIRGEKLADGKWVLQETWEAKKRRGEIKELAKAALATNVTIEKLEPDAFENGLGTKWTSCLKADTVRILSTGDEAEARRAIQLVVAVGPFFRSLFATDTKYQDDWTCYLLAHPGEQVKFLDAIPWITPEYRAVLKGVVGCTFTGQPKVAYWDKDAPRRTDGCARQTVDDFLGRTFALTPAQGWAWEGFGLYLTREISGTRYTWFIPTSGAGKANTTRARLMQPDCNWMNEALTLLGTADHPKFAKVVENDVSKMGTDDMLFGYAIAAYLLEGRAKDAPEILRAIGSQGQPTSKAVESILHMDLTLLEERVHRWLTERK
jgi:hypothetical protein